MMEVPTYHRIGGNPHVAEQRKNCPPQGQLAQSVRGSGQCVQREPADGPVARRFLPLSGRSGGRRVEALLERSRRQSNMKSRVDLVTESAVMAYAVGQLAQRAHRNSNFHFRATLRGFLCAFLRRIEVLARIWISGVLS